MIPETDLDHVRFMVPTDRDFPLPSGCILLALFAREGWACSFVLDAETMDVWWSPTLTEVSGASVEYLLDSCFRSTRGWWMVIRWY